MDAQLLFKIDLSIENEVLTHATHYSKDRCDQ